MKAEMKELSWFLVTCAVLFVVLGMFLGGCGSNIPIDPVCEDVLAYQEEEREEFGCELPTAPAPECDDTSLVFREGFEEGYRAGQASCADPVQCDEDAAYDEGFEDGAESVECDDEDSDSGWACDDFADRPPGHRPKECRGRKVAQSCRTICRRTPNGSLVCETTCPSARVA